MIHIYSKKNNRHCTENSQIFFFLIENQCPILRTEGRRFTQDNRDKLEVSGKHDNLAQGSIFV